MYSYKAVLTANYPNGRTHELMVNKNYINNHAYVSVIISKFFSSEPHNKTKESHQSWHENCSATSQHVLQLLGDFVPDALLGLSPWTHWETPVPQTSALPPKFSTAVAASGKFSVNFSVSEITTDIKLSVFKLLSSDRPDLKLSNFALSHFSHFRSPIWTYYYPIDLLNAVSP